MHLEAAHVPQHAHRADLALDLGLVGDVALAPANVLLLVVPLQMTHDLRYVLGCERAEVALKEIYRVTITLVQNLLLTSKQMFRFGLARAGQVRPKRNFWFEVNGRF